LSNVCNVAACVVARFVVGPLGDKYGAVRILFVWKLNFRGRPGFTG